MNQIGLVMGIDVGHSRCHPRHAPTLSRSHATRSRSRAISESPLVGFQIILGSRIPHGLNLEGRLCLDFCSRKVLDVFAFSASMLSCFSAFLLLFCCSVSFVLAAFACVLCE